jgi:hypothetical protein
MLCLLLVMIWLGSNESSLSCSPTQAYNVRTRRVSTAGLFVRSATEHRETIEKWGWFNKLQVASSWEADSVTCYWLINGADSINCKRKLQAFVVDSIKCLKKLKVLGWQIQFNDILNLSSIYTIRQILLKNLSYNIWKCHTIQCVGLCK